jgi:general secretion pathway protein I
VSHRTPNLNKGFTLIEVLIAVAVLAIALIAVLRVINVAIGNSTYLQEKVIAHWVVEDVLANTRVGLITMPSAGGLQTGQNTMLGQNMHWQLQSANVGNLPSLKIMITVKDSTNKKTLDILQSYVLKQKEPY